MATASSTAGLCATNNAIGTVPWLDEDGVSALAGTEAETNDNIDAVAQMGQLTTSEYLFCTQFGFAIPAGSTIDGFEVTLQQWQDETVPNFQTVGFTNFRLIKAGALVGSVVTEVGAWAAAEEADTYGSSTETGGQSWTADEVNATDFGVAVSIEVGTTGMAGPLAPTHHIDTVTVTVHYTEATGRARGGMVAGLGVG